MVGDACDATLALPRSRACARVTGIFILPVTRVTHSRDFVRIRFTPSRSIRTYVAAASSTPPDSESQNVAPDIGSAAHKRFA